MILTRQHTSTLAFIINLLGTLEDRQCDQYVRDLLYVHQNLLTDIYLHVLNHLESSGKAPDHPPGPTSQN